MWPPFPICLPVRDLSGFWPLTRILSLRKCLERQKLACEGTLGQWRMGDTQILGSQPTVSFGQNMLAKPEPTRCVLWHPEFHFQLLLSGPLCSHPWTAERNLPFPSGLPVWGALIRATPFFSLASGRTSSGNFHCPQIYTWLLLTWLEVFPRFSKSFCHFQVLIQASFFLTKTFFGSKKRFSWFFTVEFPVAILVF